MSLTDNLVDGIFYYTSSGIEKCHICTVNGIKEVVTPKGSVWQPVPSYDHFVELTEKVKDLSSENENLLNLTANQDKEIETLKEDQEKMVRGAKRMLDFQSQTIEQLRQLLKECLPEVVTRLQSMEFTKMTSQSKEPERECVRLKKLLTRINEVLK